ncbi:class I SAM-dependent methyltransferase [Streptomyces naphthomycinicus]|uniref:class I SAM-dependent methyltransferase n=1 Tax=Streptomyces naphthomycinicus TaxID=2872625 RepID=UPI003B75D026
MDVDERQVAVAAARIGQSYPSCGVQVRQGDVLCLPFEDDSFDAVWCSDTVRYLDDGQLSVALGEFRRVLRPGGVLAVRERDPSLVMVRPGDPYLFLDYYRAVAAHVACTRHLLRSRELHRRLEGAGFTMVRQHTILIEHYAPLSSDVVRYRGPAWSQAARTALRLGLEPQWKPFLDPDGEQNPLRAADGYISEGCAGRGQRRHALTPLPRLLPRITLTGVR